PVNGDRIAEFGGESFVVRLYGAFVTNGWAIVSILDDEPSVWIDEYGGSSAEGNTGTTNALFTVHLSNPYDAPVTLNYATPHADPESVASSRPPATAGSDYLAVSGTLTIAAGETVGTIPVPILGDRDAEWGEFISLDLIGSTSATISASHSVWVIVDDEPNVWVDYSSRVTEGNTGTTSAAFTVRLSAAYDAPVTVDFATVDGSSTAR